MTRLTFEVSNNIPICTPDGRAVTFTSKRAGQWNIYQKPADGSGEVVQLTRNENVTTPGSWSPDGKILVFMVAEDTSSSGSDTGILRLDGESGPEILLGTSFNEQYPMLSPDGRRFVMVQRGEDMESSAIQQLNVVLNWFDELNRLVPTERR